MRKCASVNGLDATSFGYDTCISRVGMVDGKWEFPREGKAEDAGGEAIGQGSANGRFYATRLRQLLRVDMDESAARDLWRAVTAHRRQLTARLGRDVGQRVALFDYVTNMSPAVPDPQIVAGSALQAMERRAVADPLTDLFNRAYFETALRREIERCRRTGGSSALLLIDLDRFKQVNDTFGHRAGDDVLRRVGRIVQHEVRAVDIPCRYGGDELAALLTDTDATTATRVAERIRAMVTVQFVDAAIPVTTSIGVAQLRASSPVDDELFLLADRALYAAKRAGGNCVVLARPDGTDALRVPHAPPPGA